MVDKVNQRCVGFGRSKPFAVIIVLPYKMFVIHNTLVLLVVCVGPSGSKGKLKAPPVAEIKSITTFQAGSKAPTLISSVRQRAMRLYIVISASADKAYAPLSSSSKR